MGRNKSNRRTTNYQPKWPIRLSDMHGPYKPINRLGDTIQQDISFLFYTSPGEWPHFPDLGIGLRKYLFEPINSPRFRELESRIRSQMKKYMPIIEVFGVKVVESSKEENAVNIIFSYLIPQVGKEETMVFDISEGPALAKIVNNPVPDSSSLIRNEIPGDV